MPISSDSFPIIQRLDADGKYLQDNMNTLDWTRLKTVLKAMLKTQALDQKAQRLHRQGRLGTYPSSAGQEAIFTS